MDIFEVVVFGPNILNLSIIGALIAAGIGAAASIAGSAISAASQERVQTAGAPTADIESLLAALERSGNLDIDRDAAEARSRLAGQLAQSGLLDSGAGVAGATRIAEGSQRARADLRANIAQAMVAALSGQRFGLEDTPGSAVGGALVGLGGPLVTLGARGVAADLDPRLDILRRESQREDEFLNILRETIRPGGGASPARRSRDIGSDRETGNPPFTQIA